MTAISYENLSDALDDLSIRFIINVPKEEQGSVERIFFQIEEAHWFYEDFIVENNPHLPSMNLKNFASCMLQHCPLLSQWSMNPSEVYQSFLSYKFKVPVCGAIILSQDMKKVLLVKGWSSSSSWSFPQGKINIKEAEFDCAKREVMEEIGFDISPFSNENLWIERNLMEHRVRLYYAIGIPESTEFKTKTRKEISEIKWHYIADLVKSKPRNSDNKQQNSGGQKNPKFFLIRPFVQPIINWVNDYLNEIHQAISTNTSNNYIQSDQNTIKTKSLLNIIQGSQINSNIGQAPIQNAEAAETTDKKNSDSSSNYSYFFNQLSLSMPTFNFNLSKIMDEFSKYE
ncbi:mRNA decapping complex subunit 2 [Smittium culicis]|uniref:mRNA decapping complex subunit 2 n=1 Tax=Smittium culicis TaxID=133412 RepID=A0A1R1X518_9FUNG|nr:mRNA decapping complex subunit 2 [Smittium culicis]